MNRIVKSLAFILAMAMVLSGCGGDHTWAYEAEGTRLPTGLYILYGLASVTDAGNALVEQNTENPAFTAPEPSGVLKETIDGRSGAVYVSEETQKRVREYYAVKREFDARSLALDAVELAGVDSQVQSEMASKADFYETNGVSESSVREFYMSSARKTRLFNALYGPGGEQEVTEDELKALFSEKYYMVEAYPIVKPTEIAAGDDGGNAPDPKAFAENASAELQGGKPLADIAYEWMQASAADEEARAAVTAPTAESLRMVIAESQRQYYSDELVDAVAATPPGSSGMSEDDSMYVLFTRVDILSDAAIFETYRATLLNELKGEEYESAIESWGAGISLLENPAAVNGYSASKLELDDATL